MKKQRTPIMAIILALLIFNTGFARADQLLCQAKCEYSVVQDIDTPPCCKSKNKEVPVVAMMDDHTGGPSDCPHLGNNRDASDQLDFLASFSGQPTPENNAAVSAIVVGSLADLPNPRMTTHFIRRSGLSPPHIISPPHYRLFCSLLI